MNKKIKKPKKEFLMGLRKTAILIVFISISCLVITPNQAFAADPTLISTLKSAFEKIEGYIIKLATPVAAVSIGVGALMKKFSFGDEEKIRTGRNLMRGSIFSYVVVLCTDMILSLINTLVG